MPSVPYIRYVVETFNKEYPVNTEVAVEVKEGVLVMATILEEAIHFGSFPVVKTSWKLGYTWLGRLVEFADKHPSIRKTR